MSDAGTDKSADAIVALARDLFDVEAVYRHGRSLVFSLSPRYQDRRSGELLADRLKLAGYRYTLNQDDQGLLLSVDPRQRVRIPATNVVLFLVTLLTVYVVPVFYRNFFYFGQGPNQQPLPEPQSFLESLTIIGSVIIPRALQDTVSDLARGAGIEFTLALMSILLVHEMGHFMASRRRNIVTSWPYFIPAPNIIGTFGAVIKSKSPFWNRRDLIEVGAAGPIAGWVVAVVWLLWGLSRSTVLPVEMFPYLREIGFALEGESILMRAATLSLIGPAPEGFYYQLSEAAFAGWVGMLVTAINMLPIGQLDGGHILYGLGGRRWQYVLARVAMLALIVLGFQSVMWWFFAGLGLIVGLSHPPTLDDSRSPGRPATAFGIAALVILVISFTPVPFR